MLAPVGQFPTQHCIHLLCLPTVPWPVAGIRRQRSSVTITIYWCSADSEAPSSLCPPFLKCIPSASKSEAVFQPSSSSVLTSVVRVAGTRFSSTNLLLPSLSVEDFPPLFPITPFRVCLQSFATSDAIQRIIQTNRTSIGSNASPPNGRLPRPPLRHLMGTTSGPSHATTLPPFARFFPSSASVEAVCCLTAEIGVLEVGTATVRRTVRGT